ncbi:hypothetical protein CRX56_15650 [Klebsiella pneumoniae]|nr:hypothetical protein CRX56_15650 [Klebsiella pneumoniae]
MVVLVGLAIDQIAQSGLSSLSVIYYSAQLFSHPSYSTTLSNKHSNLSGSRLNLKPAYFWRGFHLTPVIELIIDCSSSDNAGDGS